MSGIDKSLIDKIKNIIWAPAKDWIFQPLGANQIPSSFQTKSMEFGEAYATIRLKCMRLVHPRIGAREFYGAVHCFVSLASFATDSGTATFNVVNTPSQLQKIDGRNLNNIIQVDELLVGPVPYLGRGIDIEIGLFSVLSADHVEDFLKVLVDLTKAANISYVNQTLPFVQPIDNAIHLLLGANNNNKLEVGLKTQINDSGYYAIIGASEEDLRQAGIALSDIKLKANYHLTKNGQELNFPYIVFSVEADSQRKDWCRIPDLLKAYNVFLSAIRTGSSSAIITELFNAFKRTATTSPDLLRSDADAIVDGVKKQQLDPTLKVLKEAKKAPKEAEAGYGIAGPAELLWLEMPHLKLEDIKLGQ